jgi:plasmid stability protein
MKSAGVTVQVRNLDPDVQETLKSMASAQGVSLSEFMRRTLTSVAERQRVKDRWAEAEAEYELKRRQIRSQPRSARTPIDIDTQEIVDMIREDRGELPS